MNKLAFIFLGILFLYFQAKGQDSVKKFLFDGYIYGLYLNINSPQFVNQNNGQFYNRLNFFYQPNSSSTFSLQLRNTLLLGDWVKSNPLMATTMDADIGAVDLSFNPVEEQNFLLNINVDRLYYQFSKDKFELTFGRQRINWGRTLVWNPNDLFNASSFFEFDYVEKPGSDAIRMMYYLNSISSLDFAFKMDSSQRITTALKYDFNLKGYDIQIIGGVYHDDITAGIGWAGNLKKMGFKGESMFFVPVFDTVNLPVFSVTAALDYSFDNGLYLLSQFMYSHLNSNQQLSSFLNFYSGNINARNLSFAKWNLMTQASYSFTPIINGSLSAIYYPDFNAFFVFPALTISAAKNFDISLIYQYFRGKTSSPNMDLSMSFTYLGLKYYF
jgi:hypothetical protein